MSQFFYNNCILICRFQGDNINHFCKKIKNRFKKIEFIKDLSGNNWISSQKKYFFLKLFSKKNLFFMLGISRILLTCLKRKKNLKGAQKNIF